MLMFEGPATLLVGGEKCIGQSVGLGIGGLKTDTQRQQQTGRPVQAPAFAHAEKRDEQQRPAQPVSGVFPMQLTLLVTGHLEMLTGVQFDPVQIVVIERQAAQRRRHG
ncbi:hypothetical protein D3C84_840010 [compost metagenome]